MHHKIYSMKFIVEVVNGVSPLQTIWTIKCTTVQKMYEIHTAIYISQKTLLRIKMETLWTFTQHAWKVQILTHDFMIDKDLLVHLL